ncbi:MAG: arylesterase [Magnetococcales bacterium]|nr:arylesterase [Magnetococcales bacterium]
MKTMIPSVILCLGDSLTEGFGVADAHCYPHLLQQRLRAQGSGMRVINAGISGDTTGGVLGRLEALLDHPVAMAIVTIGLNDAFMGIPVAAIRDNVAAIIQTLQRHRIAVVLSGLQLPTDFPPDVRQGFSAIYPHLASQHGVPLIPFFQEGVFEESRYNQWDNVHPNAAGYRIILDNVWRVIQPILATFPRGDTHG